MLIIARHVKLVKSFCLVNRKKCSSQIISFDVHNEPISRTAAVGSLDSSMCDIDCKSVLLPRLTWGNKVIRVVKALSPLSLMTLVCL